MSPPTTFHFQGDLPSLPLPTLHHVLDALRESVSVTFENGNSEGSGYGDEDRERLLGHIDEFGQPGGVGETLHEELEARAAKTKNWIEETWERAAYLSVRSPLPIYCNTYIVLIGHGPHHDIPAGADQLGLAAVYAAHVTNLYASIRDGKYPPEMMKDKPLCMHQYSRMFGECRIPGRQVDTVYEVPLNELTVRHIAVRVGRSYYRMDVLDEAGKPYSMGCMYNTLMAIKQEEESREYERKHPNVAALTGMERSEWSLWRQELRSHSERCATAMDAVEHSLWVLVLSDFDSQSDQQAAMYALSGGKEHDEVWFDKGWNLVVYKDCASALNFEHTWADGMVLHAIASVVSKATAGCDFLTQHPKLAAAQAEAAEFGWLDFDLWEEGVESSTWNRDLGKALKKVVAEVHECTNDVDFDPLWFLDFGVGLLKANSVPPDVFFQTAIQLAYHRMHKRFVPTYESGHTRLFYHGRTDTIRTLSREMVNFVKLFDTSDSAVEKLAAFQHAAQQHGKRSRACIAGKGSDRYILALRTIAAERNISVPLFQDAAFTYHQSHFVLSTSNVGVLKHIGGYSAMVKDGYGVCYGSGYGDPERLAVSITAWNSCLSTSASSFKKHLIKAFRDLHDLMKAGAAVRS